MMNSTCRLMYAFHQGTYVLKLVGDVRVTSCATLDDFVEQMFRDTSMTAVVVDLTETTLIDSTALGLIAKIAVHFRKHFQHKPVIISTNEDINRILDSMGFAEVFNLITEPPVINTAMAQLPEKACSEAYASDRVLQAHQVLMAMNKKNKDTFKDVVAALEEQRGEAAEQPPFSDSNSPRFH